MANDNLILFDTVETASGKSFPCDYLSTVPSLGFCFISAKDEGNLTELISTFTNPEETKRITYGDNIVEGYTVFVSITKEDTNYKIGLRKPFVGEV